MLVSSSPCRAVGISDVYLGKGLVGWVSGIDRTSKGLDRAMATYKGLGWSRMVCRRASGTQGHFIVMYYFLIVFLPVPNQKFSYLT